MSTGGLVTPLVTGSLVGRTDQPDPPGGAGITGLELGPELVTGGDFSNPGDWMTGGGANSWSIAGGLASNGGGTGFLRQAIATLADGVSYQVSGILTNGVYAGPGLSLSLAGGSPGTVDHDGPFRITVVGGAAQARVELQNQSLDDFAGNLDRLSIKEIL